MSDEVWIVLAGGAISVVTGIVSAVATDYFRSHEEARAATRENTNLERDRQYGVAEQILTLFSQLTGVIEATRRMTEGISPSHAEQRYDLYNQLKRLRIANDE